MRKFFFLPILLLISSCSSGQNTLQTSQEKIIYQEIFAQLDFDSYARPLFLNKINDPSFTKDEEYYIVLYNQENQLKGYIRFVKNENLKHTIKLRYEFTRKGFKTGINVVKQNGNVSPGSQQIGNYGYVIFVMVVPVVTTTTGIIMDLFHNIIQIPVVLAERIKDIILPTKDIPIEAAIFYYDNQGRLTSYTLINPDKNKKEIAIVSFNYKGKQKSPFQMKVKNVSDNIEKTESF